LKVLGIMGSPRIRGNTDLLLDEALKGAQNQQAEVEKIVLDKLKIAPCREYYGCLKDGNCVIRDDMDDLYPRLLGADAVIVASPIFFLKKGAFIAVGATRGARLFDGPKLTIQYFFKAINAEYSEELLIRGVDKRGEIKEHPTALADAYKLGQRLVLPSPGPGS